MSWPLVYYPSKDAAYKAAEALGLGQPPPGWCYYDPDQVGIEAEREGFGVATRWSPRYLGTVRALRPPIVVWTPGGCRWYVDMLASNGKGEGWQVQGDITGPVPLTVHPSINFVGIYHGWVRDGQVTDDCEGRKFDAYGRRLTA